MTFRLLTEIKELDGVQQIFQEVGQTNGIEIIVWLALGTQNPHVVSMASYAKSARSKFYTGKEFLKSHGVTGFQFCYRVGVQSWILQWSLEEGWKSFLEATGAEMKAPPQYSEILNSLGDLQGIDETVAVFIKNKLREYVPR